MTDRTLARELNVGVLGYPLALYHPGDTGTILAERGAEPHRLDPTADRWRLHEPLDSVR
jgi:hypothetical protein